MKFYKNIQNFSLKLSKLQIFFSEASFLFSGWKDLETFNI